MSKPNDEDVFDAAYFITRLHARADADKHELQRALVVLGSYAQKNRVRGA